MAIRQPEEKQEATRDGVGIVKNISILNLKGGVAKTITAINFAFYLTKLGYQVLLIDCDKQGNLSKFFNMYGYNYQTLSQVLTGKCTAKETIRRTVYDNLDVLPANMDLLNADMQIKMDTARQQWNRMQKALTEVQDNYDFCIFDCAPDINMIVINALAASQELIIPAKVDQFTFDGVDEILKQVKNVQEELNDNLTFRGCLLTSYRNNDVNNQGLEVLKSKYKVFGTKIRWSTKVDESTFAKVPLAIYSPNSAAARCYKTFTKEYLEG